MHQFSYDSIALPDSASAVSVEDAIEIVRRGDDLLRCFSRLGTETCSETDRVFEEFHQGLYAAGFVITGG